MPAYQAIYTNGYYEHHGAEDQVKEYSPEFGFKSEAESWNHGRIIALTLELDDSWGIDAATRFYRDAALDGEFRDGAEYHTFEIIAIPWSVTLEKTGEQLSHLYDVESGRKYRVTIEEIV